MLSQELQTKTDAELVEMLKGLDAGGAAYTYVAEEIGFRERHPEYRVA